jgi:hypothetical protein
MALFFCERQKQKPKQHHSGTMLKEACPIDGKSNIKENIGKITGIQSIARF